MVNIFRKLLIVTLILLSTTAGSLPAVAAPEPPVAVSAKAAVLMDAYSGQILYEKNAQERLDPASLTKIMTVYLAFDALQNGTAKLTDEVEISEAAWRLGGSSMFLDIGDKVTLEQLLKGITVASGNDATVAVAEKLSGTVEAFVAAMNEQAAALGLPDTHFVNPHGLTAPEHYMSAADTAKLARTHLLKHPEAIAFHSQKEFQYNIENVQQNRNRLLWTYPGCDGLKTGQTEKAGYCLVATAKREEMRLIAVIMGADSIATREAEATNLLNYGFSNYTSVFLQDKSQPLQSLRIWRGAKTILPVGVAESVYQTVDKADQGNVTTEMILDKKVFAPVAAGQKVGELIIKVNGQAVRQVDIVALEAVERGGFFRRCADAIAYFFARLFRRV